MIPKKILPCLRHVTRRGLRLLALLLINDRSIYLQTIVGLGLTWPLGVSETRTIIRRNMFDARMVTAAAPALRPNKSAFPGRKNLAKLFYFRQITLPKIISSCHLLAPREP